MPRKKTPEYTLRAQKNYHSKHDNISIVLPLGTKEKIRNLSGESVNAFINRLVLAEIERLESESSDE